MHACPYPVYDELRESPLAYWCEGERTVVRVPLRRLPSRLPLPGVFSSETYLDLAGQMTVDTALRLPVIEETPC